MVLLVSITTRANASSTATRSMAMDGGCRWASIPVIRTERNVSVIVTEQYARPVMPYVDYAYIVENGSTVLEGARDELLGNPDVKAAYFGY